jgi:hypothetical protein
VIEPTVGRIVWAYPYDGDYEPLAAIITAVKNSRLITAHVFHPNGVPFPLTLRLRQDDDPSLVRPYAEWMPYQKGQAAKTEAAEAAAARASGT